MTYDALTLVLVAGAALIAGAINAVAGGGSLVTFPTLVAVGLSPITASITNTVALCPGYLGATLAQRHDLAGQGRRAAHLLPVAIVSGVAGAYLLLHTEEGQFDAVVPFLLLFAALLVALQNRIRKLLFGSDRPHRSEIYAILPVTFAGIYGGYFGAGMGVIILAALGIVFTDNLIRINALKQAVSFFVNISAAVVFFGSSRVDWPVAGVMFAASLVGGIVGGTLTSKIPSDTLRWIVVTLGVVASIGYYVYT